VRNLPEVFDVERRPWIQPDGAPPERVRDVVALCPSGALEVQMSDATPPAGTTITVTTNGPLLVEGEVLVRSPDGQVIREGGKMALCRCGHSARKPFCDGSHARQAWTA
jgi:hypothetical protein